MKKAAAILFWIGMFIMDFALCMLWFALSTEVVNPFVIISSGIGVVALFWVSMKIKGDLLEL